MKKQKVPVRHKMQSLLLLAICTRLGGTVLTNVTTGGWLTAVCAILFQWQGSSVEEGYLECEPCTAMRTKPIFLTQTADLMPTALNVSCSDVYVKNA